jgi:hypothetical protein
MVRNYISELISSSYLAMCLEIQLDKTNKKEKSGKRMFLINIRIVEKMEVYPSYFSSVDASLLHSLESDF